MVLCNKLRKKGHPVLVVVALIDFQIGFLKGQRGQCDSAIAAVKKFPIKTKQHKLVEGSSSSREAENFFKSFTLSLFPGGSR